MFPFFFEDHMKSEMECYGKYFSGGLTFKLPRKWPKNGPRFDLGMIQKQSDKWVIQVSENITYEARRSSCPDESLWELKCGCSNDSECECGSELFYQLSEKPQKSSVTPNENLLKDCGRNFTYIRHLTLKSKVQILLVKF